MFRYHVLPLKIFPRTTQSWIWPIKSNYLWNPKFLKFLNFPSSRIWPKNLHRAKGYSAGVPPLVRASGSTQHTLTQLSTSTVLRVPSFKPSCPTQKWIWPIKSNYLWNPKFSMLRNLAQNPTQGQGVVSRCPSTRAPGSTESRVIQRASSSGQRVCCAETQKDQKGLQTA